jgi:diguanylate cyclase (GGDEF)-like protein
MTWLRSIPLSVRWTVPLALLGLALTVPVSAPDGTGMQWDEVVLGAVAVSAAHGILRQSRAMSSEAARPWRFLGGAAALFASAQWLAAAFPGPELDGFGPDDVLLFIGATAPVATCGLLARRVSRTRWSALIVDGLVITVALLVVTATLSVPAVDPIGAPDGRRLLILAYGAYGAIMLGAAGAMCTVSTAALRRSATILVVAVGLQSAAAAAEAMAIASPSPLWTAVSDVAVALALQTIVVAVACAPRVLAEPSARAAAPVVSRTGLVLVLFGLLSLPASIGYTLLTGRPHSIWIELGFGVVFALMALRLVLRIREDGRVTEDLVRSEEDFRGLIESSSDGIAIMDARFRLLFTSPTARSLLGIGDTDSDVDLLELLVPADRALVRAAMGGLPAAEGPPLHVRVQSDDDTPRELEITSSERPGSTRRVLLLRDVTVRRRRERELERMAYTDHLTGLPNRATLFEEMAEAAPEGRCLLVLDLDGFKAVNDVAGHESGDQLLVEVARRLHTVVREDDLVARLGGDEFAVLVTGSLDEAEEVAERVCVALGLPHRTGDWTFAVGASVGVAQLGPAGGQPAFRRADAALRRAKRSGKGCVRVADGTARVMAETAEHLAAARAEGTMSLRLDAAVTPDGRIGIVHARPVWGHPVHGEVRGQDLWGDAEAHGYSADLQRWLLREACSTVAALPGVDVAVSLPAGHVTTDGLAAEVAAALADSGLEPSRLNLSLTEETLLTSSVALVPELAEARRTGVRLCLDNYGMGHSLFALLARVPLDVVRVDLSTLAGRDDPEHALRALAAIAHTTATFGLTVIAGGIRTPELLDAAVSAGASLLHGRALPHDLTVEEIRALLGEAVPA